MDEKPNETSISPKKLEANRRNAEQSTGPRTDEGKSRSRVNAVKHGILSSAFLISQGKGAEDPAKFDELLGGLLRDLAPEGTLEEMLVEKIAVCWWRQRRALKSEAGLVGGASRPDPERQLTESRDFGLVLGPGPGVELDRILRYETTIQRQMVYAINQLERLQRTRKGEHVPAPVSVQLSSDQ